MASSQSFSQTFGGVGAGADADASSGGVGMSNYAEEKGENARNSVIFPTIYAQMMLRSL